MKTETFIKKYTKATKFDGWLVRLCGLNYYGYLLPRWKRIVLGLGMGRFLAKRGER